MEPTTTLTALFTAVERGEQPAAQALFGALYDELHRLARRELARHAGPMSVGATTLLHQAYIEMAARESPNFPDRGRFMGYAARVMRGLIIDHARERCAQKRGGHFEITALPTNVPGGAVDDTELSEIGAALDELASTDADLAEIVDLKFFCGFSFIEIAALQGVAERTIQRKWEKARIYLYRSIRASLSE
jgi:RNA polymerase sigma factor (TIGR02999 family)